MYFRVNQDICHLPRPVRDPDQDSGPDNSSTYSKIHRAEQRTLMPALSHPSSIHVCWSVWPHWASPRDDGLQYFFFNQGCMCFHLHPILVGLSSREWPNRIALEFHPKEFSVQETRRKAPAPGYLEDAHRAIPKGRCRPVLRALVLHLTAESCEWRANRSQS